MELGNAILDTQLKGQGAPRGLDLHLLLHFSTSIPCRQTLLSDTAFWVAFCGLLTCFTKSWVVLLINLGRAKDQFKKLMKAIDPFPRSRTYLSFIRTQFQEAGHRGAPQPLQCLMLGSFRSHQPLHPHKR